MHRETLKDWLFGIAFAMLLATPFALQHADVIERLWRMVWR
ncbi:hypothetical protein [Luteolibacter soli]|uniref:Uncharacterized protein n=1 Tax=Luteolibacter soli TaxID=3135280 RepID=A0ABU9AT47_9BACT